MIFTEEDIEDVKERAATKLALRIEEGIVETFGKLLGETTVISVTLAARVAGITPQHARRTLPIVCQQGAVDGIQFSDVLNFINDRKNK